MAQSYNQNSIFYSWSTFQKVGFWFLIIAMLAGATFLTIPIGVTFFLLLFLLPKVWKDPFDMNNPLLGMMQPGTKGYKAATFVRVLKMEHRSHMFSPTVMWGFGPPEDDIDKDLRQSMLVPPTRISAYWSLVFAIAASSVDILVSPYIYPIWGQSPTPAILRTVVSAIFFFASFQVISAAYRYYIAESLSGVDHVPAVMFHKIPKEVRKEAIIKYVIGQSIGLAVAGVINGILVSVDKGFNWIIVMSIGAAVGLAVGLLMMFNVTTRAYREEFQQMVENRDRWNGIWEFMRDDAPYFSNEVPVPGMPGKPGGPPEGEPPGEPHVWVATFGLPATGANYLTYADKAVKIGPSIPQPDAMVCISPIPRTDQNTGEKIQGSVSNEGFRVWWTDETITINDLLARSNDITPEFKEVAVRALIVEPLAGIARLKRSLLHSYTMMTAEDSKVHVMKVNLVPSPGITEADFMNSLEKIESELGARWVRVRADKDNRGKSIIELYVGTDGPSAKGIVYPKGHAESRNRDTLLKVDWKYVFHLVKLTSPQGSPTMIISKPVTEVSNELVFDLPPGVNYSEVTKRAETLKTSSGNAFLEIHAGVSGEKDLSRREKRQLDRFIKSNGSVSQFTAVAAREHPLDRMFYFKDYMDQLITGRELGVAKIDWSPGVRSNGSLAMHSFAKDDPHLVLAGSSGSGKSVLIYSMISQMAANNDPRDAQVWIVDPKIGYQQFQHIDSVTRYVDSWTPRPNVFFESTRDLMKEAVEEMARRNGIFRFAKTEEPIDKLGVARQVGLKQGPNPDGSPNELLQPYIFIVIDEAAMLFAGAPNKEDKELQAEILYYATKLARESRSAGIHMLISTQYPTKESLPSIIKQQSGRIGLATRDQIASKVIIDTPGLEELWIKGSGKIVDGKNLYDFRGYLMEDGRNNIHTMVDILKSLPSREDGSVDGADDGVFPGDAAIEVPEPEGTIFNEIDDNPYMSEVRKRIEDGSSDKIKAAIDSISEKEFDKMSLAQFKKIILAKNK